MNAHLKIVDNIVEVEEIPVPHKKGPAKMIEAEVHRNEEVLMRRTFHDPGMSLESALKQLEMYVTAEQLNNTGECLLRVRFSKR